MKKYIFLAVIFAFTFTGVSYATTITLGLPEYSSPYHSTGTYNDQYLVGTFNFNLLGEAIVSATISGQWGNSAAGSTAHNLLFADAIQIANTHDYSPDPYYNTVPWSYTFSNFATLYDGQLDFFTVQTSETYVRLGQTTLTINTAAVPEPLTLILLGFGLTGLAGVRRFRK